jgi:hypothetical protein
MVGLSIILRRLFRVWMPVLLALHLVAAQATMPLPAPQPATVQGASAADTGMHCHDRVADSGHDTAPVPAGHCDPGHCHCPVALVPDLTAAIGHAAFLRRVDSVVALPGKPSQRQTPDLRPPILR